MTWRRISQYGFLKLFAGGTATVCTVAISTYLYKRRTNDSTIIPATSRSSPSPPLSNNYEPTTKWDFNWDRRQPKSLVKPVKSTNADDISALEKYENQVNENTPTATRHLFFIRHGQYELKANVDEERVLTKLGKIQADKVGERFKQLDFPYLGIVSSTMTRAKETTAEIHKHLPHLNVLYEDCLREGSPIPPEPPINSWRPEKSYFQDGARIEHAFRQHVHRATPDQKEDSYEIFVCHANVIRYFVCRALQLPPEAWLRLSLHHASITWLRIQPAGTVCLMTLGDCGHMTPELMTRN